MHDLPYILPHTDVGQACDGRSQPKDDESHINRPMHRLGDRRGGGGWLGFMHLTYEESYVWILKKKMQHLVGCWDHPANIPSLKERSVNHGRLRQIRRSFSEPTSITCFFTTSPVPFAKDNQVPRHLDSRTPLGNMTPLFWYISAPVWADSTLALLSFS